MIKRIALLAFLVFNIPFTANAYVYDSSVSSQSIQHNLFHDIIVRFMSPYVYMGMNSHYGTYFQSVHEPYPPEILKTYPQHTYITGIQRIGKYGDFEFLITVRTKGYVDKFVPVVESELTFKVKGPVMGPSSNNEVFFEGAKTLNVYKLPDHFKHIVKKPIE